MSDRILLWADEPVIRAFIHAANQWVRLAKKKITVWRVLRDSFSAIGSLKSREEPKARTNHAKEPPSSPSYFFLSGR